MPVPSLPDEIILQILLFLQPYYAIAEEIASSTPWNEGTCTGSCELWRTVPGHSPLTHNWKSVRRAPGRYHPVIVVNHVPGRYCRRAAILDAGDVSRQWRRASYLHPFWTDLAWHRLLDMQLQPPVDYADRFFKSMAADMARCARIRTVWLDLASWGCSISLSTLIHILEKIPRPERVHTFVLEMDWATSGDDRLIRTLARRFKHLRRVHIGGRPSEDVFHGLSSAALKHLASHWQEGCLTHLSLAGYGPGGNFSWKAFSRLLGKQRNVRHLAIGYVRGGINFGELSELLPGLQELCINFTSRTDMDNQTVQEPSFCDLPNIGALKELRSLILQCLPGHDFPVAGIHLLLQSIAEEACKGVNGKGLRELRLPRRYQRARYVADKLKRFECLLAIRTGKVEYNTLEALATISTLQKLWVPVPSAQVDWLREKVRILLPRVTLELEPV
ncbi:hypothetical protein SpCBS45565_g00627 [Spizellomyces sp. 'palustris']|nr:hypothetical protein SpCBS45565_g00627 [Spizellomyces sp. 'palustris']